MDARAKAAAYINIKMRTEQEVIRYLQRKGFSQEEIDETVSELKEYRYIDDFEYCLMYFRYGFDKGRGVLRIERELAQKGVDRDVISRAYDELDDVPDQLQQALEIGRSMIGGLDVDQLTYDEKRKLKARIGRRVVSRGFSTETAYKVMDRLL